MYSPLTKFFNPELAKKEKEDKEREELRLKQRKEAFEKLNANKDFQELVIGYIIKRKALFSDISTMPEKGNLENELFGRRQRIEELDELLNQFQ